MSRVLFAPDKGQLVPVRLWARRTDAATERLLQRLAAQPWVVHHVASMADAHLAEGVAVGTVFATRSTVVPRALGGDLGCGMAAIGLDVEADSLDRRCRERIVAAWDRAIPSGDSTHTEKGAPAPDALLAPPLSTHTLERARAALLARHLGTLGGGNHVLELDRDVEGHAWLLVHSGSRGLGAAVFAHHAKVAGSAPGDPALSGLSVETEAGRAYLADHTWALAVARENRDALARRAVLVLAEVLGTDVQASDAVDVHHNFIARERWYGEDLLVHRKGAVRVPEGELALVPGSMGTASYLVRGLGAEEAFGSCSHGAGRVMSRAEARSALRLDRVLEGMRGVVVPRRQGRSLVEEAPAAYRDIGEVLDDQRDLVRRVQRLTPLAVLKG